MGGAEGCEGCVKDGQVTKLNEFRRVCVLPEACRRQRRIGPREDVQEAAPEDNVDVTYA
jgi:hypothetical protein